MLTPKLTNLSAVNFERKEAVSPLTNWDDVPCACPPIPAKTQIRVGLAFKRGGD